MTDNELDKILRDSLAGYREEAPDVWEGIQKGLDSRRRWRIVWRTSGAVAAAAACLAIVLTLVRPSEPSVDVPQAIVAQEIIIAHESEETAPAEEAAPVVNVAPIAQQIKQFTGVTAQASVKTVPAAEKELQPVVETEVQVAEQTVTEDVAAKNDTQEPVSTKPSTEPVKESAYITSENIPEGFWDEEDTPKKKHTSQLSILTNLSSFSSKNASLDDGSPMFAPSAAGGQGILIEPKEDPKFNMPVSFGIQFKTRIAGKFYVGAGVNYTYLFSSYVALVNKVYYDVLQNSQHYIGIPVNFYYDFVDSDRWNVYVNLGGAIEKGVGQRITYGDNIANESIEGVQWSAMAGVGVEYRIIDHLGVYLDPSLAYYFDCDQPLSIRTQQPLMAKFELGFRFNF